MNFVLPFHMLQADIHICKINKKIAPVFFDLPKRLLNVLGHALDYVGKHCRVDAFQFEKFVNAGSTCSPQIQELINGLPVSKCQITIEKIKGSLKLFTVENSQCVVAVAVQTLNHVSAIAGLCADERFGCRQIGLGDSFINDFKVTQGRKEQPFDLEPIGTELKADEFSVSPFTLPIADPHLADSVPSRNDCCSATDQGLEIVNNVPPAVAPFLTGNVARLTEKNRQQNSGGGNKAQQNKQTVFVQIRQSFPRNPLDVRNSSHFFEFHESGLKGFAP